MIPPLDGNQIYGASHLNRLAEAANVFNQLYRNRQGPALRTGQQDHGLIWVRNNTYGYPRRFRAVTLADRPAPNQLGAIITSVSDGETPFLQQRPIVLSAVTPGDHAFRTPWAVLLEDLPPDEVGPAVIAGVTIARVNVTSSAHRRVYMTRGEHALQSGFAGQARILWCEAYESPYTTGEQWAVIEFADNPAVKLHAKTPAGGISAGSWNVDCDEFTPAYADCVVFEWEDQYSRYQKLLDLSAAEVTQRVYNGVDEAVGANKLIAISSDDDGIFCPVVEGCNDGCAEV